MSSKRGESDRKDSWGAAAPPRKWLVVSAVAACACSVVVLFFTAPPGPETAAAAEAAITKSAIFELRDGNPFEWRVDARNWPSNEHNWPTPAYRIANLNLFVENTDPGTHDLNSHDFDFSFRLDFLDSEGGCIAFDTDGPATAVRSLSHVWAGFSDAHARRRLASLTESAVPFTIVFTTIGRDPILQHIKARLELVPPHDASVLMLEAIVFPLRCIAAFTALVSSAWLGWAAVRAAME